MHHTIFVVLTLLVKGILTDPIVRPGICTCTPNRVAQCEISTTEELQLPGHRGVVILTDGDGTLLDGEVRVICEEQ